MSLNPIHLGITLMRTTDHNQLIAYGRDPKSGIDFNWHIPGFPLLPEHLLIRAGDALRHLACTRKACGAWLLYLDNRHSPQWQMLFPEQTCDTAGELAINLKNIALPPSARLAGTIVSMRSDDFASPGDSLLHTDGVNIVVDVGSEWCVSKSKLIVGGELESLQLRDIVRPMFDDRSMIDSRSSLIS